jgi:hypothetical protein
MYFLQYVQWLTKDEDCNFGWISIDCFESVFKPESGQTYQDLGYIDVSEYVTPVGEIFVFLVKKDYYNEFIKAK